MQEVRCRVRTKHGAEGSKVDRGAQRVGIGTRPGDVNMRVLCCNTIRMRLVGALATIFLFRGKSKTKEGFRREAERQYFILPRSFHMECIWTL